MSQSKAPLIDFLYVDQNRVYNLISQIQRGLRHKQTFTDSQTLGEETTNSTKTTVEGKVSGDVKVPLVADVGIDGKANFTSGKKTKQSESNHQNTTEELDFTHLHKVDILKLLMDSDLVNHLKSNKPPCPGEIILIDGDLELFDNKVTSSTLSLAVRAFLMNQEVGDSKISNQLTEIFKGAPQNIKKNVQNLAKEIKAHGKNLKQIEDRVLSINMLIQEVEKLLPNVAIMKSHDQKSSLKFFGSTPKKNYVESLPILLTKFGNQLGTGWKVLAIADKPPIAGDRMNDLQDSFLFIADISDQALTSFVDFQSLISKLVNTMSETWGLAPLFLTGDIEGYNAFTPILVYREVGIS